jgi:hypothetical protein
MSIRGDRKASKPTTTGPLRPTLTCFSAGRVFEPLTSDVTGLAARNLLSHKASGADRTGE